MYIKSLNFLVALGLCVYVDMYDVCILVVSYCLYKFKDHQTFIFIILFVAFMLFFCCFFYNFLASLFVLSQVNREIILGSTSKCFQLDI